MRPGKKLGEVVTAFFKSNFNMKIRGTSSGLRERKYENVKIQESFEKFDRERKKKRLLLIEYQKETRKKLIENQYKLKGLIRAIKEGIEALDKEDDPETKNLLKKIESIEENGEYQDILVIVESSKSENFKEFKELLSAQKKETDILKIEDRAALAKMNEDELKTAIKDLEEQLTLIEGQRREFVELDKDVSDLESSLVILNGMKRIAVLNRCTYYETHRKMNLGMVIHPETLTVLADVQYKVENNLPVRKDFLYEIVPEMFEIEIEQLAPLKLAELRGKFDRMVTFSDDGVIKGFDRNSNLAISHKTEEHACSFH